MFVYKELKASDVAVVPFNAHKQYVFDLKGHSDSLNHIYFITHSWAQRPIENYSAANCGHRQLEHLFYGRYPLNIAKKFGNANYIHQHRELGEEIYTYSIPQDTFGVQIKPKSLEIETTTIVEDFRTKTDINNNNTLSLTARFIDDGIGNIWHLESNVGSGSQAFITESFPNSTTYNHKEVYNDDRIFYLNPINGYKLLDLEQDEHGNKIVRKTTHSISYTPVSSSVSLVSTLPEFAPATAIGAPHAHKVSAYNKEDVYEDSYYHGLVDYNNIRFSKYQYFPNYRNIPQSNDDLNQNLDLQYVTFPHTTFMDFHHQTPHHLNVKKRNQNHRGGSYLKSPNNEKFHFNPGDNFAINFNLKPVPYNEGPTANIIPESELHIIGKSTTKTVIASSLEGNTGVSLKLNISGANQEVEMPSEPQYPFEVFLSASSNSETLPPSEKRSSTTLTTEYHSLNFRRSDGNNITTVSTGTINCHPDSGSIYNITCQYSSSELSIWVDGIKQNSVIETVSEGTICGKELGLTQNNANIYIGCQGGIKNFFTGSLQNISMYSRALKEKEIIEHNFESKYIGTPVVGNIFYSTGLITINNPYYFNHFKHSDITSSIRYKNTMPLVENEYQCTLDEHEFNYTNNVSTRCITNESHEHLANFATGSLWNPYITTIGLYNEDYELLVVGKLGQPVRVSDETDSTFVLRWDT